MNETRTAVTAPSPADPAPPSAATSTASSPEASLPSPSPLRLRNFRLLWLGEAVSLLGDQFYLVALPWLTLSLGGDGFTLGVVLTAAAVPRAVLMLLGGAVSDALTPRMVMVASNALRALAVTALTVLVVTGSVHIVHLVVLAAVFGSVDAFYHPSLLSIVPALVARERLEAANALVQGSEQLAMLAGPGIAGVLVAVAGLAPAFGIDAVTFVLTLFTLLALRLPPREPQAKDEGVLRQIGQGVRYTFRQPVMRTLLISIALLNFAVAGPAGVGLPMLAATRFAGAASFGLMMSVLGAGSLAGALLGGSLLRRWPLGRLLIGGTAMFALAMASLGLIATLVPALALLAAMGLGIGALNVRAVAWLQGRADAGYRGRVMSLVTFASVGLAPLSLVVAGALAGSGLGPLFACSAALMLVVTLAAAATPELRRLGEAPEAAPAA